MQLDKDRIAEELGLHLSQDNALALTLLAKVEGFPNVGALLQSSAIDSVVPGWCKECQQPSSECEPDARENWCEHCGEMSVESCLVIAGII